jgi:hypothetical protein
MSKNHTFPEYFPPCCPDDKAIDANGTVFRIVQANTQTDNDFLSHHELGTAITADPCARCGISVFDSFQGAVHRQKLSPRLGKFIAEGILNPSSGKTSLPNKASRHMEWWPYSDVDRPALFKSVISCT